MSEPSDLADLLSTLFQAHPWHGIPAGEDAPELVNVYVEIVPAEPVKYELDKPSGHLRLDRPQRFSSFAPTLYGFLPQTYCGTRVAQRCAERIRKPGMRGDGDPLDICVLSEKPFSHGGFLLTARPVGGLRVVDRDEADDKIVAVLQGDLAYGAAQELSDLPGPVLDRLRHYFLTYKLLPGETGKEVSIAEVYGRAEAHEVIRRSQDDYRERHGPPERRMERLRELLAAPGRG